jgi:hypothetical protein
VVEISRDERSTWGSAARTTVAPLPDAPERSSHPSGARATRPSRGKRRGRAGWGHVAHRPKKERGRLCHQTPTPSPRPSKGGEKWSRQSQLKIPPAVFSVELARSQRRRQIDNPRLFRSDDGRSSAMVVCASASSELPNLFQFAFWKYHEPILYWPRVKRTTREFAKLVRRRYFV